MNEAEFDKFADEYDRSLAAGIAASGEGPAYFSEYKIADIARAWSRDAARPARAPDEPMSLLDFGAGVGNSVPYVRQYFADARLTCLDLSERSLAVAERRFPGQADYVHFDGARIPGPSDHYDVAYAMCVFHHIPHDDHVALLRELHRVLKPGGSLFVFEHNPYNPLTVRVVNTCPFDENAHLIKAGAWKARLQQAGFGRTETRYRIFFPHLLRWLRPLEHGLAWLPLGAQYSVRSFK
jgi:ubiquinone/menaquinone biosynthesis C-methylase UbiE